MKRLDTPIPDRMKHLPLDPRGYPIPSNVFRDKNGTPHFTINDELIRQTQIRDNLCPICGKKNSAGLWFVGGPLSAFHPQGAYNDLPMHKECAVYALKICPYLAMPSYHHRLDEKTLNKIPEEDREVRTFVDPTMLATRPPVFVLARTKSYIVGPDGYHLVPMRPWLEVEVWKDGAMLTKQQGMIATRNALYAFVRGPS